MDNNKRIYRFPSPYDVAAYFNALGLFTRCDFGTSVLDCRTAIVEGIREEELRFVEGYAEYFHGREVK